MKYNAIICFVLYFIFSCDTEKTSTKFSYVDASKSAISFNNTITENDSVNVVTFQYTYNGGGVGIGDFNNDGWSDIVFSGNQVTSKLYLNRGDFKFEILPETSNFKTNSWVTGVSIVDINTDGWDDIYLSVGGANCNNDCENLLFVNQGLNKQGIPTFIEQAKAYQLNDGHYSQQAAFFDYDSDGDLDAYIAHNGNVTFDKNSPVPKHYMPKNLIDYLLENQSEAGTNHPIFKNVSDHLGITQCGFSLGLNIHDFNNDNLPDIYVSNDFITEDLVYINNGIDAQTNKHKGFLEVNKQFLTHQTYNAMGVDIADINNDSYPDIFVLDMLPFKYERQKRMLGAMNYDKFQLTQRNNYTSQFMHNTLQLHNGMRSDSILKASEIGYLAGMASTDWSWAPLLADFDNDGDKDVYITNGYVKDITDLDFINYSSQNTIFGSKKSKDKQLLKLLENVPGVKLPNHFFENTGGLKFDDVSLAWKAEKNSFSNGAAYADLDNDGDLDIVVNNINQNAFLIKNNTVNSNFIRIKLKGSKQNKKGIGSKVTVWQNGKPQYQYQSVIRGYLSSVEPILHFGLGTSKIDSLQVLWPDGSISKNIDVTANAVLEIDIISATKQTQKLKLNTPVLNDLSSVLDYKHKENQGHDYVTQHLLVRQYSKFGPCVAAGNIDGEKGDELFIGGSKGEAATLWFQNNEGHFEIKQKLDSDHEDTDAVFVDVDNDNDLDLYVASGGTTFPENSNLLQDRLYLNNGKGYFTRSVNTLPKTFEISACVKPNDFDKDGDIDFFIGSRIVKGHYPKTPKSQLLVNNTSTFETTNASTLQNIGMVTDASWQDLNKDGWDDLIVVGEWMPITIYSNNRGVLEKSNPHFVSKDGNSVSTSGWWNTIAAKDFDNDGDIDFIVGNQGENGFIIPKKNKPVYVYNKDYDANGSLDPVVAQYYDNTLFPVQTRDDVLKQITKLKERYITYKAFSKASFIDLLEIENLEQETLKADTFSSIYVENLGDNTFEVKKLPEICQIAPINAILAKDVDNDGYLDAFLVGNDLTGETNYGQNDALTGLFLKGSKTGFKVMKSEASGFYVPKQSHHIITFQSNTDETLILATQNSGEAKVFSINKKKK